MTRWMDQLIASSPRLIGLSPTGYLRLAAIGAACASILVGVGTATLDWLPWAPAWASLFGASAVLLIALALFPSSRYLSALSGAMTIVAWLMRGGVLVLAKALELRNVDELYSWWQVIVGVGAFGYGAFITALLFFTRVEFVASVERARK